MTKSKNKAKAVPVQVLEEEPVVYVVRFGKHNLPCPDADGAKRIYIPGQALPELTEDWLAAHGNQVQTEAEYFAEEMAHKQAKESKAAKRRATAKTKHMTANPNRAPMTEDDEQRARVIAEMNKADRASHIQMG